MRKAAASDNMKVKRAQARSRSPFLYLVLYTLYFSLVSCGFHLRGTGKVEMPAALSVMQVRVEGNLLENHPLLVAVKNALRTQTDVQIQESGDAPRLLLYGELSDSRVLSVTSAGNVDEYLLKYEVSFRLADVDNKLLSEPQTVKVQRDHQFDRLNVLAKEREEQELRREMQRDAAQQILRRLSRISIQEIKPMEPPMNTDQHR
jgi:LPS-assembly lipoprotein